MRFCILYKTLNNEQKKPHSRLNFRLFVLKRLKRAGLSGGDQQ